MSFGISQRILTCCGSLSPQQLHRYPPPPQSPPLASMPPSRTKRRAWHWSSHGGRASRIRADSGDCTSCARTPLSGAHPWEARKSIVLRTTRLSPSSTAGWYVGWFVWLVCLVVFFGFAGCVLFVVCCVLCCVVCCVLLCVAVCCVLCVVCCVLCVVCCLLCVVCCGLRVAECGMRNAGCGLADCGLRVVCVVQMT